MRALRSDGDCAYAEMESRRQARSFLIDLILRENGPSRFKICDAEFMVSLDRLAKLIAAMIAMSAASRACSIVEWVINVGPDFKVVVEDRGHPARGVRVRIEGNPSTVSGQSVAIFGQPLMIGRDFAVTNENGVAFFHGVHSGSKTLTVVSIAGSDQGVALNVTSKGETEVRIPLWWMNTEPFAVRSLRGRLRGSGSDIGRSSLNLVELASGRKLKTVETNGRGDFDFENTLPGLYAIGAGDFGQFIVEVDRAARFDELDLELGRENCGGTILIDRNKCPRDNFRMDRLLGQVTDASGAIVPNASIDLLNADDTLLERLQSDAEGKFASSRETGTYDLLVRMAGFPPYRATVRLGPTSEPVRQTRLTIPLGMGPTCRQPDLK
jgi:hypothetical protein